MTVTIDPMVAVAILGLVNVVKTLGLTGKALTLVSMLIGVGLSVLAQLLEPGVLQVVLVGLLGGLAASGFYDFGAMLGGKVLNPKG